MITSNELTHTYKNVLMVSCEIVLAISSNYCYSELSVKHFRINITNSTASNLANYYNNLDLRVVRWDKMSN